MSRSPIWFIRELKQATFLSTRTSNCRGEGGGGALDSNLCLYQFVVIRFLKLFASYTIAMPMMLTPNVVILQFYHAILLRIKLVKIFRKKIGCYFRMHIPANRLYLSARNLASPKHRPLS